MKLHMISTMLLGASLAAPVAARQIPSSSSGSDRPVPYPVFEPEAFTRAIAAGTRTRTGRPGPRHWTNYAHYTIEATLDPATRLLTGRSRIRYENRSPDELTSIVVHLHQNLFAPGALRSRPVPVTGGVTLTRLTAGGVTLADVTREPARPGYIVDGTILVALPAQPLPPGGSIEMEAQWSFTVTPDGAPRGGTDGEVFFVSYWYPQIAVYDDVNGWNTDPYQGNAEFYMGYADYDVSLTVPAGWLIGSTGELQNGSDVLSTTTLQRLARARTSRETTHVVAAADRGAGRATSAGQNGHLTWRFLASNVRDFAFGTSNQYLWDATGALAGDALADGRPDTTVIHTFYRPERVAWAWDQSARYEQHSIEFLSAFLWPYRYPIMTAIDGPTSCSGMEYPMITCIGGQRDTLALYSVLVHETAHMWFPMMVGSNETAHSWQDEGLTRFNQSAGMQQFFNGYDRWALSYNGYAATVRAGHEVELMRHGDLYPRDTNAFGIASYDKMSLILLALRGLLGEETFMRAYREYGRRWLYRHPTPYDFFNTIEDIAGRDLDWFWRTWFWETWTLDQAVTGVSEAGGQASIRIEDRGLAPMPVRLRITREGGTTEWHEVPVEVWLDGAREHLALVGALPRIVRIEIDPERWFPDVDRENNVWSR
jgi:hypothetical protein